MEILDNSQVVSKVQNRASVKQKRVTAIKPALKNEHRVNVFLDDKYSFSLDLAQLVDEKIKVGQTVDAERLAYYQQLSEFGKLYQRTLEWVLVRPRSERETRDYLRRKQQRRILENQRRANRKTYLASHPEQRLAQKQVYRDADGFCHEKIRREALRELPEWRAQDLEKVLQRLLEKGYVDDIKFAEYYVENRMVKKGISKRRLEQELYKKGVSRVTIEQVLQSSDRNEEEEIKKIIEKKQAKYTKEKLIQYLVHQGFDYQMSKNLVYGKD